MFDHVELSERSVKMTTDKRSRREYHSRDLIFRQFGSQGFGERHNSWAWSMTWWQGKLYVGTNRAFLCAERAAIARGLPILSYFPFAKYPPNDPDTGCPPDDTELPLGAEIWRWTPETDQWERVYLSPPTVPIPGEQGKYTARDIGFRDLAGFTEEDGTQALYASGVSTNFVFHHDLSPTILRTTDGQNFEAIPMDTGTFLGDLKVGTFRTIAEFKNRMFVIAGGIRGDGYIIESGTPKAGNDSFRKVSPDGLIVFEMLPFNGALYIGTRDSEYGYSVMRTDATGEPPYRFVPVVSAGGYADEPSRSVISMQVYKGRLYVGMDKPGEIIRVNPDDSWDLVAGTPRRTPSGWKYPLSGLESGFNNWLNGHIWRMQVHKDRLYIGTMKMATHFRHLPGVEDIVSPNFGFDLYETSDGCHFAPITRSGFDDKFAFGIRSFADTPHGICFGSANSWYGLQVWRGSDKNSQRNSSTVGMAQDRYADETAIREGDDAVCRALERVEIEQDAGRVILSWERPVGAKRFRIWRAHVENIRSSVEHNRALFWPLRGARIVRALRPDLYLPPLPSRMWVPSSFVAIGSTEEVYFADGCAEPFSRYLYYVCAENEIGELSLPSNLVAAPALHPPVTFVSLCSFLERKIASLRSERALFTPSDSSKVSVVAAITALYNVLGVVQARLKTGETHEATEQLRQASKEFAERMADHAHSPLWQDTDVQLCKLIRRVSLRQAGITTEANL